MNDQQRLVIPRVKTYFVDSRNSVVELLVVKLHWIDPTVRIGVQECN